MSTSNRMGLRRACAIAIACSAFAQALPAAAQSQNEAAARALFNQGRDLMKVKRYEEACSKFEAARKLYASPGVLLNLADCHERINRTASAWTEFGDAADAAANAGRADDEAEGKRRQAALQDRLSLLAIHADALSSDEIIKRDGTTIDLSAWASGIPVDPGTHTVSAEASGRKPWSATVEVEDPGKTATVQIPRLVELKPTVAAPPPVTLARGAEEPNSPPPQPSSERPSESGNGQRTAGWVIGGAGLAALATSGVLAIVADSQFNAAENESGSARHGDSVQAGQLADVATALLIAGSAITVAGFVVWFTAPNAPIAVGANGPTLFLAGQFQ